MIPTLQKNEMNQLVNTVLLNAAGMFTAEVAQYWNAWLSNGVLVATMAFTIAKTVDIFRKKKGE